MQANSLELKSGQPKGEVVVLDSKLEDSLTLKEEMALRLYSTGKSIGEVCETIPISHPHFWNLRKSEKGKQFLSELREEIEDAFRGQALKVKEVIDMALSHPLPEIALAGANTWMKYCKAHTVKVEHSAEDVVKKLMER